jgi:putative tricarboxylic transport membrane protein
VSQGDLSVFVTRPISLVILLVAVAALFLPFVPRVIGHGRRLVFGSGSDD